jgi:hypothetical protein
MSLHAKYTKFPNSSPFILFKFMIASIRIKAIYFWNRDWSFIYNPEITDIFPEKLPEFLTMLIKPPGRRMVF